MRIAHFIIGRCNPDSANGVDKTVYYLSKTQAALDHEVAVFSLSIKPPLPIPKVQVKAYPPKRNPFALPKKFLWDLKDWRPQIVHMHSVYIPQNWALHQWLHKEKIPFVVTPHGGLNQQVTKQRFYLKLPYKYLMELQLLNRAAFVHSVGDTDAILRYGVKAPVAVVPNGLDLDSLPSDPDPHYLTKKMPELKGKRIFLFIGRLDPDHKGLDLLLAAFAQIDTQNCVLVLVGPYWKNSNVELHRIVNELQIERNVIFLGPVFGKEKFDILASCDVFVHPSRWDGLPFSVLEACALAKPCLVSCAANPLGLIVDNQEGFVIEPKVESLKNGLSKSIELDSLSLKEMGFQARNMVKSQFQWRDIAQNMIIEYKKLCK
ncbi:MAG TPA: glycosyltransferase [bacterium]|nr:glycosyltransferase [bacterium]HPG44798.1 glycosyltransferase [bacterium]HPM99683.1 glycosyltransferase [bacterium]